ncbi:ribosomal protein S18-alanine N-acetyltransferase [Alkalimarinus alittae]|uniref:[Ribosomal protein bS18]-alanine N-acetyltransferase n=1 Tax=Alkalimarinus alittae TaxID=2961619 RepID=A0ABY6N0R4_9ALTE|nr:ribosomal protein S18-alanine N-acetyltransferase [Alkalimarinus alittae]UZE95584.1 ribosomal protein S18-alanine N-acetyltransferase [Alkalimarinus alittae]
MAATKPFQNKMKFREMLESDLTQVLVIERNAYSHPWSDGNFRDSLTGNDEVWLLESEGIILGHGIISVAVGEAHLLNICVASNYQRQGLGRHIIRYLIGRSQALGADIMFLEVRESNAAAYALYLSEGYEQIGVRKNYYPLGISRENAIVMSRPID